MFQLIDAFEWLRKRDFRPEPDAGSVNPLNPYDARPYDIGEWLHLDANYRLTRGGDNVAGTIDEDLFPAFPFYLERGRTDMQAIANGRATVLWSGTFEAETDLVNAGIALHDPLTVQDVNDGGIVRRGLGTAAAGLVIGYCTRVISATRIRFIRTLT